MTPERGFGLKALTMEPQIDRAVSSGELQEARSVDPRVLDQLGVEDRDHTVVDRAGEDAALAPQQAVGWIKRRVDDVDELVELL